MSHSKALIFFVIAPFLTSGQLNINLQLRDPRNAFAPLLRQPTPPLSSLPPPASLQARQPPPPKPVSSPIEPMLPPLSSPGSPPPSASSNELLPVEGTLGPTVSITSGNRGDNLGRLVFIDAGQLAQRVNSFWSLVGDINQRLDRRPKPLCRKHVCHDVSLDLQRQCCELAGVCCHRHSTLHHAAVHEPVAH